MAASGSKEAKPEADEEEWEDCTPKRSDEELGLHIKALQREFQSQVRCARARCASAAVHSVLGGQFNDVIAALTRQFVERGSVPVLAVEDDTSEESLGVAAERYIETTKRRLRQFVSGDRKRFQVGQFDLDLSYLTSRIIVMSTPSEGVLTVFRNPINELSTFFDLRHQLRNVLVFNLCEEKTYDYKYFNDQVIEFPMPDHEVCAFRRLHECCTIANEWLTSGRDHIVAIHCKGGKGRSGLVACCLLLHIRLFELPVDALEYFAIKRTREDSKFVGVEGPSQLRFVAYYGEYLRSTTAVPPTVPPVAVPQILLKRFIMKPLRRACNPALRVVSNQQRVVDGLEMMKSRSGMYFCNLQGLRLVGDVKVEVIDVGVVSRETMLFFYFHTFFVRTRPGNAIHFSRKDLDIACKDIKGRCFPDNFCVELTLKEQIKD